MPRKPLIKTSEYPYHIYNRANNRKWWPIPIQDVWEIFIDQLQITGNKFDLNIHCFILMNNHYHMLIQTPHANLDKVMFDFNHKFSLRIGKKAGVINQILGSRYKWSLLVGENNLLKVYRYIYQNPIRAKSCTVIQNYPYHSLQFSINNFRKVFDDLSLIISHTKDYKFALQWINELSDNLKNEQIKKGLKKTTFKQVYIRTY